MRPRSEGWPRLGSSWSAMLDRILSAAAEATFRMAMNYSACQGCSRSMMPRSGSWSAMKGLGTGAKAIRPLKVALDHHAAAQGGECLNDFDVGVRLGHAAPW